LEVVSATSRRTIVNYSTFEKESDQGSDTGTWACVDCGTEFVSYDMWEKLLRNQQRRRQGD